MPVDIGQELYEQIKAEFDKLTAADGFIKAVAGRISAGTATMEDVSLYAQQLGVRLRQVLADKIRADVLPNGQMYYNIAEKILDPILHDNYDLVNKTAADVQRILDKRNNINIKPQKAAFPDERVQAICNAAKDQEAARAAEIMGRASDTVTRSFADDYMEENAKFRSKAGFQTYIVRATDGKCCDWCSRQAGKYSYPDATPHEVFQRHDNCGCTVTYENGGMRQDVWSKRSWEATPEELAERKELEEKNKPVRFSPEEAAVKEKEQLDKQPKINNMSLDNGSESGIIEESKAHKQMVEYLEALGVESVPTKPLSTILSESEIIDRLAGGDMTHGSCASLAFAYAGNKGGVDVLDFRGGKSCDFFCKPSNIKDVANLNGVKASIVKNTNDFKAVSELLKNVEADREYILATGKHAAVIRKAEKGFEYLNMQDPNPKANVFKPLTTKALSSRFDCKKTHTSYGYKMPVSSILIDRESLSLSDEFKDVLRYINTDKVNQMKGVKGYAK